MSSVERCRIRELPDSLRLQLDKNSFFGSPGFAELWESMGGTPVCWMSIDNGVTIAALVGVEFRRRPVTRFQAMPDGCYERLFLSDVGAAKRPKFVNELLSVVMKAGYAKTYISDYFKEFGLEHDAGANWCETLVVDISAPDWLPPDSKLQSEIRKAAREGVEIHAFDANSHLDGFMDLMTRSEKRHGRRPKYSREFFLRLAKLAETDGRVKWLYVHREGVPVVSHIYLVDAPMALNWQIYYDKEFSSLKANQFTMFTTARMLTRSGVTQLNLGATPPDAESVKSYKEKWGGVSYRYPMSVRKSWLGRIW